MLSVWVFTWNWIIRFLWILVMVLETLIMLCVTKPKFLEKLFLHLKLGKWAKNRGFFYLKENLVYNFHWICSIITIYIISSVLGLSQSDCRIFKSTTSPTQIKETVIICMLIQIHKCFKLIEKFLVGLGQKWLWPILSLDSEIDCFSRMNGWN